MTKDDLEARYEEALSALSDLVKQRNDLLLRLETLSTLPLNISPRSGHVSEFDLEAAHGLLDRIQQQMLRISEAMEIVNRYAEQCGLPVVEWLKMPPSAEGLDAAEM